MKSAILTILAAGGLAMALAVPSFAQDAPEGPSPDEQAQLLAAEIRAQAAAFGENIVGLRGALDNLPQDMAAATELFDEMIADVEAILAEVGPESSINRGVGDLQSTAEQYRDEWTQRCEETSDSRACARVEMWNTRVVDAVAVSRDYQEMIANIQGTVNALQAERPYVIDDMRLGMFDAALEQVGAAVGELSAIQENLQQLGDDVDPDLAVD